MEDRGITQSIRADRRRTKNGNTKTQASSRQFKTTVLEPYAVRDAQQRQAAQVAFRLASRARRQRVVFAAYDAGPGEDGSQVFAPVPGIPGDWITQQIIQDGGFELTHVSLGVYIVRTAGWSEVWSLEDVQASTVELDAEGWPLKDKEETR